MTSGYAVIVRRKNRKHTESLPPVICLAHLTGGSFFYFQKKEETD